MFTMEDLKKAYREGYSDASNSSSMFDEDTFSLENDMCRYSFTESKKHKDDEETEVEKAVKKSKKKKTKDTEPDEETEVEKAVKECCKFF